MPPAWSDVWICPWPNGHIQAVGTDDAGRRQYRYHDEWRVHRDREKFERVVAFAESLPKLRKQVAADLAADDLAADGLGRDRVMAAIVRLLDVGLFRIGGEEYAEEHETFGVASLHKDHVRVDDATLVFDYPAKGSIRRTVEVSDSEVASVVAALRHRRSSGPNLFAYKKGRQWCDAHAPDVNSYIKSAVGEEYSAKDFRTWAATLLAALALGQSGPVPGSPTARRRAVVKAVKTVAAELGNTPAVCRASYVDPRVIDRFECGETVGDRLPRPPGVEEIGNSDTARRRKVEKALIDMLTDDS